MFLKEVRRVLWVISRAVTYHVHVTSNGSRVTGDSWIGKDLKEGDSGPIEVVLHYLPEGTEETHEKPQSG
jgi:hypothetical protein